MVKDVQFVSDRGAGSDQFAEGAHEVLFGEVALGVVVLAVDQDAGMMTAGPDDEFMQRLKVAMVASE